MFKVGDRIRDLRVSDWFLGTIIDITPETDLGPALYKITWDEFADDADEGKYDFCFDDEIEHLPLDGNNLLKGML